MSYQKTIFDLIKSMSGQGNILTIPRLFVDVTGDLYSALMLSQCLYWTDKTKNGNQWVYKSTKEWQEELGMTRYRVKKATGELEALGLIETKLKKANGAPTTHYKVNRDALVEAIANAVSDDPICSPSVNPIQEGDQNDNANFGKSLTETTQETTTENIAAATADGPAPTEPHYSVGDTVHHDDIGVADVIDAVCGPDGWYYQLRGSDWQGGDKVHSDIHESELEAHSPTPPAEQPINTTEYCQHCGNRATWMGDEWCCQGCGASWNNIYAAADNPPKPTPKAKTKPRDPMFDAIAKYCWGIPVGGTIAPSIAPRIGKVKKELLQTYPELTAGEFETAIKAFYAANDWIAQVRDPGKVTQAVIDYKEGYGKNGSTAPAAKLIGAPDDVNPDDVRAAMREKLGG